MISQIEKNLFNFLDHHWDKKRGLLLAFSGGPDSLALLHFLASYKKNRPLSLALAHVNHGWREESDEEANQISLIADQLGLTLHLTKLVPNEMTGNLEAKCRQERLKFFRSLCTLHNYQAVLLAHHADDLAETVLKRLFEGSSLSYLSGLKPVVEISGVVLWRPLLDVTKQTLAHCLAIWNLTGFDDCTNRDPKFLRARFRTSILPQLSREFGKQVAPALYQIGKDAAELIDYLDKKVSPFLSRIIKSDLGLFCDLSLDCPESMLEVKHLIRKCCEMLGIPIRREVIETVARFLCEGAADKQVFIGLNQLYIDRRRLFLLSAKLPVLPSKLIKLEEGDYSYGRWHIQVHCLKDTLSNSSCSNWRSLWQERGVITLPEGEYDLGFADLNAPYPRSSPISKWWTNHKIPAFLRNCVPVIYKHGSIVHEFLTGKAQSFELSSKNRIEITIAPIGYHATKSLSSTHFAN